MNVSIVLVRPKYSGNLGSVARAMKNMGFSDLRLVNPTANPFDKKARYMSVHAEDLLQQCRTFDSLSEAIQEFKLVIGTSRRVGKQRENWYELRDFSHQFEKLIQDGPMAILFGAEDTGLTNEEISLCQRLIYIPTHPEYGSLNLAQATLLVCYEIFRASQNAADFITANLNPELDSVASFEELEYFYQDLKSLLIESEFLNKPNTDHPMGSLRNLFNRARPTGREIKILRGILRQIRWWSHRQ